MSFRTCFGSQGSSVWPIPTPPILLRKEWLKGRFLLLEISCHGKTNEKSSCHGGIWFQVNSKEYNKGDSGWQMAPLSAKPCVMRRKKRLCFWSLYIYIYIYTYIQHVQSCPKQHLVLEIGFLVQEFRSEGSTIRSHSPPFQACQLHDKAWTACVCLLHIKQFWISVLNDTKIHKNVWCVVSQALLIQRSPEVSTCLCERWIDQSTVDCCPAVREQLELTACLTVIPVKLCQWRK